MNFRIAFNQMHADVHKEYFIEFKELIKQRQHQKPKEKQKATELQSSRTDSCNLCGNHLFL